MRRLNLVLLALQLCGAVKHDFSIHSDLLAFPQYEVIFSDAPISEKDAGALLENKPSHPTYSADFSQTTNDAQSDDESAGSEPNPHTYELMNMSQHNYLCSIPVIQSPPAENETATELAKAAEDRELSRAAAHGWGLLSDLEDTCLYFGSGWWTYSFCHNREIVQYHAKASGSSDQPPKRDPRTAAFTLGREPAIPAAAAQQARREPDTEPLPAELQVTGDHQRYLVQKLERGDVCDLTGRERTIEVQYQCMLGLKHDKIGFIKEVTICAYLMVIYTPRLCKDVAFLPREEPKANPIKCQLIVADVDAAKTPLLDATNPKKEDVAGEAKDATSQSEQLAAKDEPVNIGGVLVGARNVLSGADEDGKPPTKLTPPKSYFPVSKNKDGKTVELVAKGASKEEGGKVEVLTQEEIEDLDLNPDVIDEMREQLESLSGDSGWKLEVVDMGDGEERELRGWIYGMEDGDGKDEEQYYDDEEYMYDDDEQEAGDDGSQERFKDEL